MSQLKITIRFDTWSSEIFLRDADKESVTKDLEKAFEKKRIFVFSDSREKFMISPEHISYIKIEEID